MTNQLRALLKRIESTDQGTFGNLIFGGQTAHTVELPWRDNKVQHSCIPPGTYTCAIVQSPKFGRVYEVQGVPGRSAILIHSANFGGDVDLGWQTELLGCIAPCESVGTLTNKFGKPQRAGLSSRAALARLMAWAGGEPFVLEIAS